MSAAAMPMSCPTTAELIAAVQRADSSQGLLLATQALAACPDPAAASTLVEVLGFNNPGAAVAAVDGLIGLGPGAVDALLQLDPENYGARAWAVRALAGIGDVRGLELLVDALGTDVAASVRRAAARGLGQIQLEGLPEAERLVVAERCLEALLDGCRDGEWVVRYAVVVGLEALAPAFTARPESQARLRMALQALGDDPAEEAPVVQLRARLAVQRLSCAPAMEASDG
jgi:phycocyanobilin lyase beta subunit